MCVGSVLSAVTENKAFDLPAYAERGGNGFWGTNGAGGRGAFVVCVFWRRGDLKRRAYCFRGS